jgi:hypothetical protein
MGWRATGEAKTGFLKLKGIRAELAIKEFLRAEIKQDALFLKISIGTLFLA